MNEVQIFPSKEFGEIRTILIKGTEYFFGVDIATALEYKRPRKAVTDNCKGVLTEDTIKNGGGYPEPLIPIGDIYRLIVKASSQSNSEEIKEKARRFESLVFDEILPQIHKTGSYRVPQTIPEQIQLLAQGNVELNQKVDTLEQRFNKFEDEMPVTGADMDDIQTSVRRKGTEALGGKRSNAYRDKSTRTYVYADIQCELRRQFGVKRYKEIKHKDAPEALRVIEEYRLPIALRNRVNMVNAQQAMEF